MGGEQDKQADAESAAETASNDGRHALGRVGPETFCIWNEFWMEEEISTCTCVGDGVRRTQGCQKSKNREHELLRSQDNGAGAVEAQVQTVFWMRLQNVYQRHVSRTGERRARVPRLCVVEMKGGRTSNMSTKWLRRDMAA